METKTKNIVSTEAEDRSSLGQLVDPNVVLHLPPNPSILFNGVGGKKEELELGLDESWKGKEVLSIGDVKELWSKVKEFNRKNLDQGSQPISLNELLHGAEVIIPSLQIPERNPELEKRLKELRNKLDEQEYARMTRNVNASASTKANPEDSIGHQMKQMNSAIVAAVQFVISLAAAFFFGFSGIQLFMGELDLAVRLLLGIGSAVVVGIAELYVLIVMLDDTARTEEIQGKNSKKIQ